MLVNPNPTQTHDRTNRLPHVLRSSDAFGSRTIDFGSSLSTAASSTTLHSFAHQFLAEPRIGQDAAVDAVLTRSVRACTQAYEGVETQRNRRMVDGRIEERLWVTIKINSVLVPSPLAHEMHTYKTTRLIKPVKLIRTRAIQGNPYIVPNCVWHLDIQKKLICS